MTGSAKELAAFFSSLTVIPSEYGDFPYCGLLSFKNNVIKEVYQSKFSVSCNGAGFTLRSPIGTSFVKDKKKVPAKNLQLPDNL